MNYSYRLFQKCRTLVGENEDHKGGTFHIYPIDNRNDFDSYRIDCGELGSCQITHETQEEKYNINDGEWEWVDCDIYSFSELDECSLTAETVLKLINIKTETIKV